MGETAAQRQQRLARVTVPFVLLDGVVFLLLVVDGAVDFNDEAYGGAAKIRNEAVNGELATEFDAAHLFAPQTLPKLRFRGRRLLAHLPGQRLELGPECRWRLPVVVGEAFGFVCHGCYRLAGGFTPPADLI